MPDGTNGSEAERWLARLRELDGLREDLIRRQAAMGERHRAAQQDLTRIVAEMKVLGTSPQTIQADLVKSSDEVKKRTVEYEGSLTQLKSQLDEAEQRLLQLESKPSAEGALVEKLIDEQRRTPEHQASLAQAKVLVASDQKG